MSLKNVNHQKRSFTWSMEKPSAKDYFLTVFIFVVCTLIGLLFQKLNFTDTNIVTIYILGILLTSIVTDGYLCSVAGSFLSVFLFCFFLTAGISAKSAASLSTRGGRLISSASASAPIAEHCGNQIGPRVVKRNHRGFIKIDSGFQST